MATRLYVGGIPYRTTEEAMKDAFSQAGQVTSVKIIIDRMTGRSRGFGFVEMASSDEAQKAISALNGSDMGGRTLTVNEARPQEPRSGGPGRSGGGFNDRGGKRDRW